MFSVVFYHAKKGEEVRLDTSFTDHRWGIPSPVFCEAEGRLSMITDCGFFAACQRLIDQGFKKVIICDRDEHCGNGRSLPN